MPAHLPAHTCIDIHTKLELKYCHYAVPMHQTYSYIYAHQVSMTAKNHLSLQRSGQVPCFGQNSSPNKHLKMLAAVTSNTYYS